MKNSFFSKFAKLSLALLFVSCIAFVACKPEPEAPANSKPITSTEISADDTLIGKWADDYSDWNTYDNNYDCQIAVDFIETASYGKQESKIYVLKTTADSGYIYYQFSTDVTGYGPAPDYASFTIEAKGKWGAIAFKDLTANSVKMCDFADPSSEFPTTLEDCIKKYTIESGYFSKMPEWIKL